MFNAIIIVLILSVCVIALLCLVVDGIFERFYADLGRRHMRNLQSGEDHPPTDPDQLK